MRKVKIELKILDMIYRNHKQAYAKGMIPSLFSRAKVYRWVGQALGGHLLIEGKKQ